MVKMYVQTPLKFWFHIKFSREYDYVNEYPYSAKLQNMTCWTESGTQSSNIKGLDKCVWCWVCSVLSKQRGEVVWWGGGVRFTKANCGQESQWPYTDCGPAVTGMFASWFTIARGMQGQLSQRACKATDIEADGPTIPTQSSIWWAKGPPYQHNGGPFIVKGHARPTITPARWGPPSHHYLGYPL